MNRITLYDNNMQLRGLPLVLRVVLARKPIGTSPWSALREKVRKRVKASSRNCQALAEPCPAAPSSSTLLLWRLWFGLPETGDPLRRQPLPCPLTIGTCANCRPCAGICVRKAIEFAALTRKGLRYTEMMKKAWRDR